MKLQTTIITGPNEAVNLQKEARLLKSAILYSDNITLISPTLTSIVFTMGLSKLDEKTKVIFLKSLEHVLQNKGGENLEKLFKMRDILKNKRIRSKEEIVHLKKIEAELKKMDEYFQNWGNNMYEQSGLGEFQHLIDNGTVKLKHLDVNETNQNMALQIFEEMTAIDYNNCYPIFDNTVQELAKNYYSHQTDSNFNFNNLNEIFVAKEFVLKLPNIDLLGFSEIINVKTELHPELNKFKGLINSYSEEIKGIPFDATNKMQIEKKYNYDFLPQLKEVQEKIESNRFYKLLIKDLTENFSKYSIYIGVGSQLDVNGLFYGGGASAIESIAKSYNKQKEQTREIKNSSVYFYHHLSGK